MERKIYRFTKTISNKITGEIILKVDEPVMLADWEYKDLKEKIDPMQSAGEYTVEITLDEYDYQLMKYNYRKLLNEIN